MMMMMTGRFANAAAAAAAAKLLYPVVKRLPEVQLYFLQFGLLIFTTAKVI